MKYPLRVERRILWGHCGVSTSRPLGFANINLLDYELHSQDTRIRHEMDYVDRLIYGLNIAAAFEICTKLNQILSSISRRHVRTRVSVFTA